MKPMDSEWRHWIQENLDLGIPEHEVLQILMEHQFDPFIACSAILDIMGKRPAQTSSIVSSSRFEQQPPSNGIEQPWSVIAELKKPKILVYSDVLSYEECDKLIEMSESKLKRSTTIDEKTGQALEHKHRTSQGTFFQLCENEFIQSIDERLSTIMNLPIENGEGLQILNYGPGGEYKPHFDYFPPEHAGSAAHMAKGGQRVATLILYLNNVKEGGETIFPEVSFNVTPYKGCAVYFSYFHKGQVDPLTLHGGAPVIKGEKWIATKWVRESAYL